MIIKLEDEQERATGLQVLAILDRTDFEADAWNQDFYNTLKEAVDANPNPEPTHHLRISGDFHVRGDHVPGSRV